MGLTSSLYSGVSGLVNMGTAMQVIGDNISNVNTTGFKASNATFQDIMAQSINTARGGSQVGRGSSIADVSPLFTQGSFESTSSPLDLAIAGNGFFMVTNPKMENSQYFTRAGQFHLDQYGYMVNPAGMRAQGWAMEVQPSGNSEIVGSIKDIQITNSSPPVATSQSTIAVNLDSRTTSPVDARSLEKAWIQKAGTLSPNVDYEYKTTLNVYDSLGNVHELTVFFDKAQGEREWEFLVTMPQDEDKNIFATMPKAAPDDRGLLMRGYIHFTPQGNIDSIYSKYCPGIGDIDQTISGTPSANYANTKFYASASTTELKFRIEDIEDLPAAPEMDSTTGDYVLTDKPSVYLDNDGDGSGDDQYYIVAYDPSTQEITLTDNADPASADAFIAKLTTSNTENVQRFGTRVNSFYDPSGPSTLTLDDTIGNELELDTLYKIDPEDETTYAHFLSGGDPYTVTSFDYDNMTAVVRNDTTLAETTYSIRSSDIQGDWFDASYGDHNYPELKAYFLPPSGSVEQTTGWDTSSQLIEINFGASPDTVTRNSDGSFTVSPNWNSEAITTTQYANRSSTLFYDQNGFGPGFLESVNVDSEGVISGHYSNGRIIELAQLALARFSSPTDLSKEGGNLWAETTSSGTPVTGPPRTNGLGSIAANALEQSTVDMGTEFVKLITTQRAFQANSKVITTTDNMLNDLINMKR